MKYLSLLVFTTGAVTLGVELSASRLLEPAFGNNQVVWAALIGLILLYLAGGAWLGGKLADRFPHRRGLEITATLGALGVGLIPTISPFILQWAALGLEQFQTTALVGALLSVLLLFSIPITLLGAVSPWVVRLALSDVVHAGQVAGRFYAIATAGSLIGTFLPVLWLIPAYGTRWTFYLLALALLAVLVGGTWRQAHRWVPLAAFLLILSLALWSTTDASIRRSWDDGSTGTLIYEDESLYNYIAVRQWGSERHLKLNDGVGIHSVYHPETRLSLGIWDYFLLAPFFQPCPTMPCEAATLPTPQNLLIIGLAAGTVSELYTNLYGPLPMTGIELDPQIITVGQQYFGMNQPNLTAIAADGRRWLLQQPPTAQWDIIVVDAYRPPYIPFHLTTVEFFALLRRHLSAEGVVAINVGRTATNYALVDALAATLAPLFPTIYAIDEPGPTDTLGNTLLVATGQPTEWPMVAARLGQLPTTWPPEFLAFVQQALPRTRVVQPPADALIFTDDRAPVEAVVHQIIWDFMAGR
ncbi:MAG: fused MFS/spermidine synthase [Caldilineaceae bacterium]|nr:fused MFS/spermidine synthase [Caldilineaceae bacterium]